jgi:branched-chain amino acid transport system substrate-binding protein
MTEDPKLLWRLAALAVAALLLLGGIPAALPAAPRDRLTIGFVLPLTGVAASEGNEVKDGAELAARLLNDRGGLVAGGQAYQVALVFEDDKCSPQGAVDAANRLVARGVDFVGGNFCSSAALADQPIFAQAGIPQIFYAYTTALTAESRAKTHAVLSVRLGPQAKTEMAPLAKYAVTVRHTTRFFALAQNTDFGRSMVAEFRAVLEKLGGHFVAEPEFYPFPQTTDYRTLLAKAKASGADAVLAMGLVGEMIGITLQSRELGLTQTLYGSDLPETLPYQQAVGAKAEGIVFPWIYDDGVDARRFQRKQPEREAKAMSLAYLAAFHRRPPRNAAWGWGTVTLIAQAAERARTVDRVAVARRILSGEKFDLPFGTYGFLPCGQADMGVGVATYESGPRKVLLTDRDFAWTPPVVLTRQALCP